MSGAPAWPDDKTEVLGRFIDQGVSITKTARAMRLQRGAVSGRAYRLGWRFGAPRTEAQRVPPYKVIGRQRLPNAKRRPPTTNPAERPVYVCCAFDRDTYAEIMLRVRAEGSSRAQIVRELVEWGLEAVRSEAAE